MTLGKRGRKAAGATSEAEARHLPPVTMTVETGGFAWSCALCRRPLPVGVDVYIYRGDTAFCSPECREHRMNSDERNESRQKQPSAGGGGCRR